MAYRTQAHLRMLNRDTADAIDWGPLGCFGDTCSVTMNGNTLVTVAFSG
jgi:hypothetical protein